MATRTHAREMVVGLLYAYSLGNDNIFNFADMLLEERKIRNAQASFARELFKGVIENLAEIDSIIDLHLKSWEMGRLGVIDKCILRLGVYEITKCNIDAPIAINEAVEIAKTFGEENTGKFVNGVLDAISKKSIDDLATALKAREATSQTQEFKQSFTNKARQFFSDSTKKDSKKYSAKRHKSSQKSPKKHKDSSDKSRNTHKRA